MVDDRHMHRAIELAQKWPHTHPNPRVGAVVVDDTGETVGEGCHEGPGTDHAEIVALKRAGEKARGSTVYVTLEPCSHHGLTPPCADALIGAAVKRVVVGAIDPDARVSGRGVERLRHAGIEVTTGFLEEAVRQTDPAYFRHRETGLPRVTLKWAMTLDGSVAATDGTSQWITASPARNDAHDLRSQVDAVVIGTGTLRADDPRLDVRIDGYSGAQPRAVVVAGREELPESSAIWDRDPLVVSTVGREIPSGELVGAEGVDFIPDPVDVCRVLAERGLLHLLLEGGPKLAGSWWRAGVVTDGVVYIGAKVGTGTGLSPLSGVFPTIDDAVDVEFEDVRSVGGDVKIAFHMKERR